MLVAVTKASKSFLINIAKKLSFVFKESEKMTDVLIIVPIINDKRSEAFKTI